MKRREKIVWCIIGAIYATGFLALSPAHYEICEINQYTEHKHCTSYQLLPFLLIEIKNSLDSLSVVFTALATIAVAVFTFFLKRSTDKLWDAGERQLRHLDKTAQRQLRAYVAVKEILMEQFREPPHRGVSDDILEGNVRNYRMSAIIENGGQTPTRRALININHVVQENVLSGDFKYPDGPETETAAIGPGGTYGTPGFFVSLDDVRNVVAKKLHIFVWGWIDYDDVFENTSRHRTEFCVEITPDEVPQGNNIYLRFPNFGRFNGIDNECLRPPKPYVEPK